MKRFLGVLQFMTRIPIKVDIGFDDKFYKGIVYFPSVGLVLGVLYFIMGYFSIFLFDSYIGSVLIILYSVILTGGLHLDGVGDTFDGIYSYRDKDKILEIMKDSRLGTNALLAILFLILLKIGFIYKLIDNNSLYAIIMMPIFGRLASVYACYKNNSPREHGMGNTFLDKVSNKMLSIAILSVIMYICIIGFIFNIGINVFMYNLFFILILWILVRLYTKYITNIIGGITGDILGSVCEMSELIYLIYIGLEVFIW